MLIFDRIDSSNLERREWHLWLLAFTVIFVLALGLALFMYPAVFSDLVLLPGEARGAVFFGFCVLAVLVLGYFVDRQLVISRLRQQLFREQQKIMRIRHEASIDLLSTLPDFDHFQDRLVMEYRRAASTQQPLSLVVVVLKCLPDLSDSVEISTSFGDAAKAMMRKLGSEDSIYLFGAGAFCIMLPGVTASNAYLVGNRLREGLQDASGASGRFSFQIQVFNYPEHGKTAREIEEAVRPFTPKRPLAEDTEAVPTASS